MTAGDPPSLIGHECSACGRIAFPPDPYGCERCGSPADALLRCELDAVGRIEAVAVVHRHHRPEPPTPFTVATIVLDAGVSVKAVVVDDDGRSLTAPPPVGAAVRGVAIAAERDDDGVELLDLRFEVASGGGGR